MSWEHHLIAAAFFFVVGSAVGSFLNVCIYRIPQGMSVLRPKSRCPRCLSSIAPRDNLPIIGWLLLRGRCRCCRLPISVRYALVEAFTGAIFVAVYLGEIIGHGQDPIERGPAIVTVRLLGFQLLASLLVMFGFMLFDIRQARRQQKRSSDAAPASSPAVLHSASPHLANAEAPLAGSKV